MAKKGRKKKDETGVTVPEDEKELQNKAMEAISGTENETTTQAEKSPERGLMADMAGYLYCPLCGHPMLRYKRIYHRCENRTCKAYQVAYTGEMPQVMLKKVVQ